MAGKRDSVNKDNVWESVLDLLKDAKGKIPVGNISDALLAIGKQRAAEIFKEKQKIQKSVWEKTVTKAKEEPVAVTVETIKEEPMQETATDTDLDLSWDSVLKTDSRITGVQADSISDGLTLSIANLGRVDIDYIATVTGSDCQTVINTLKGVIFQNPETWCEDAKKGWETADEYLSGNMLQKWKAAYRANQKYDGLFRKNLVAIKKVLKSDVSADEIYITLGSPWVPTDVIDEFILHLLGRTRYQAEYQRHHPRAFNVKHDELTGSWEIPNKSFFGYNVASTKTYGTSRMSAIFIIEKTLNMKTVQILDEVTCTTNKSGKKRVVNQQETIAAVEKQQKIIQAFQSWVWEDETRKERLVKIYENKFAYYHRRNFNGDYLTFPTMSPSVTLYPYQKNAVARVLLSPNTLLAHDVGSGKTYVMIAAGMELVRMGLSTKNLFVVPNNIVGQWRSIFYEMYPTAKVLCVTPTAFTPAKRQSVLREIRDGQWDGIIMPYSCFEQIPLSRHYYVEKLKAERRAIEEVLAKQKKNTFEGRRKAEALSKELAKIVMAENQPDGVFFDELKITRLFVDEAHNFKNVPLDTKIDRVLGISSAGSKKCQDMMDKVKLVQKNNNGGGVVFATGTPITNSITDAYIMQKYLQDGSLSLLELSSFDSWIGMFAERKTEFEVDVDTNSFRLATRFSNFHNLTEMTALLSQIADFHQVDKSDGIPEFLGYTDTVVKRTPDFAEYLKEISARAENVRAGNVDRKTDNMLKITTDGRKAALDLRLVNKKADYSPQSKVARCAENVAQIYFATMAQKSTQLVFCDSSTPKTEFNLYDETKRLLVFLGLPENQIVFVHSFASETAREKLFKKVRDGEIRVLIGSTFKLGLGVNVQDKLIALHHLDVPWRPADMTQREGRILRQGNTNEQVFIFRYITEGSFDAYSWQLLETKQRFICKLLAGSLSEKSGADIESTVLNYAEVKALAVGNPLIKQRVEVSNELERLKSLQLTLVETKIALQTEQAELTAKIAEQKEFLQRCKEDGEFLAKNTFEYTKEDRRILREGLHLAVVDNILEAEEKVFVTYRGFDIVLPANMTKEEPFVRLKRAGKYKVELGESEVGDLIRVDNFLDGFADFFKKQKLQLLSYKERKNAIAAELLKDDSYTDKIEEQQILLDKIDNKLGVKK